MNLLKGDIVYILCIWTTLIQYPRPKYEGIGERHFMTMKFLLMGISMVQCTHFVSKLELHIMSEVLTQNNSLILNSSKDHV
jgi:hypothetical protein